jgi:hypothetical protein
VGDRLLDVWTVLPQDFDGSGRDPSVPERVLMAPGSVLLPGDPARPPNGRLVIVACPEMGCGWMARTRTVPQSCRKDYRHAAPRMLAAWLYCSRRCWGAGKIFNEYVVCTGDSVLRRHEVHIDRRKSYFL